MVMLNIQTTTTGTSIVAFLAGLLAGKGVFGFDAATWTAILGGVGGLAAVIYNAVASRKSAVVSETAKMPEVKTVVLENSAAADSLSKVTPNNVVTQ